MAANQSKNLRSGPCSGLGFSACLVAYLLLNTAQYVRAEQHRETYSCGEDKLLFDTQIRHQELLDAKVTSEEYLRTHLRNTSSLEIIQEDADFTPADSKGAYIIVRLKFRTKNGLGSLNINEKVFRFDKNLQLQSVQ